MRPQTSQLLRTLIAGLAFTSLAATAQSVVVTVSPTPTVTDPVSPPQQKKSFTSLIAAASLAEQGVTTPTDADLGVAEANVQAMRDSGMGWGEIANSMNLRLGDVVSAANKSPRAIKTFTDTDATADRALRAPQRDSRVAAAGDTATNRGMGAGSSGNKGGASNGGAGGGGKGGGAGNSGGSGGGGKGGGAGNGGGNSGGGKGGGNGGGNGGGKGGGNGGGNGGGKGGGNR